MFRKTIFGALALAAGIGAAVAIKFIEEQEKEKELEDDEVHFIHISDEDDNETVRSNPLFQEDEGVVEEEIDIDEYLNRASDLIDPKEAVVPQEVLEVCAVYPYLDPEFVQGLLEKNDSLNKEFPEDTLITISHMTNFPNADVAGEFMKIMDNAGYVCTQVASSVKAVKKFFTEPGAIISDVLNVANQTRAVSGEYAEYTITK